MTGWLNRAATRLQVFRCPTCGKWCYSSRKLARKAARDLHPHDSRLQAYRCPVSRYWHYGHRPWSR